MTASSDLPLSTSVRVIRQLAGPPEAPWPGRLVRVAAEVSRLSVDAAMFDAASPVWRADHDGHVVAPYDVVRRRDGHDLLFPVCVLTLDRLLARRGEHAPLTDGERLTVAVSVLRGLNELAALDGADDVGEWWVTDDARPVFAVGCGSEPATVASVRLLTALASGTAPLGALLERCAEIAADPSRLGREIDALEADLFRSGDAEPLAIAVLSPGRHAAASLRTTATPAPPAPEPRGVWAALARHADADLAELVSRVTTGVWRRARRPATGRRRGPWLAAAAVASAIVLGAVFVPSAAGGGSDAAGAPPMTADGTAEETRTESSGTTDADGAVTESVATADAAAIAAEPSMAETVTALLDARQSCAGDPQCLDEVQEDPALAVPAGVVDLPSDERRATLVDEFGDVGVVRVDAADGSAAQLVVVAAREGKWLLRDVYDAAQQP